MAAVAATAQAATLTIAPVKPCYVPGDVVTATGTGFTPSAPLTFAIDGSSLGQLPADTAGSVVTPVTFGAMPGGIKTHALSVTDATNPALTASVSYVGTNTTASVNPGRASAGTPRRIKGRGFTGSKKVYMHVRRGRYKTNTRIARAKGPCGTFSTRRTIVPLGARDGVYKVQFDGKKHYSNRTRPRVSGTLTVFHH
jgi:hypothetical protein